MEFSPLSPTTELSPLSLLLLLLRLIPRPTRGTRTMLLTPTPMLDMDMEDTTTPHTPTPTLPTPTPVSTPTTVCLIILDTTARERLSQLLRLTPRLIPRLTPGIPTMVLATPVTHTDMVIISVIPDISPTTTVTTQLVAETDTELLCLALANNLNVLFVFLQYNSSCLSKK